SVAVVASARQDATTAREEATTATEAAVRAKAEAEAIRKKRSEERRVGKEGRCRRAACHWKKKRRSEDNGVQAGRTCDGRERVSSDVLFSVFIRMEVVFCFFFSSRRRHTRLVSDWSSDVCSSDLRSRSWPPPGRTRRRRGRRPRPRPRPRCARRPRRRPSAR